MTLLEKVWLFYTFQFSSSTSDEDSSVQDEEETQSSASRMTPGDRTHTINKSVWTNWLTLLLIFIGDCLIVDGWHDVVSRTLPIRYRFCSFHRLVVNLTWICISFILNRIKQKEQTIQHFAVNLEQKSGLFTTSI